METFRKVILPILRVLIWGVIAFALIKIAFPSSDPTATPPEDPTFNATDPVVEVTQGTVANSITLDGTISTVPPVPARITLAGAVSNIYVTQGQWVDAGTNLFEVTQRIDQEPIVNQTTGEVTNRPPKITKAMITAPVSGNLSTFTLLKDQIVSVGDVGAQISTGTLKVDATLTPEQQFRLLTLPTTAMINITGGPAPFECTNLHLVSGESSDPNQPGDPFNPGGGGGGSGNQLSCTVPDGVTAFNGLPAKMEITSGESVDVLLVPVTAVQGRVQTGNVWVVAPDGSHVQTAVGLGLTDGEKIEITSGVNLGDKVLMFAPTDDTQIPTDEWGNPIIDGGFGGASMAPMETAESAVIED